MRAHFISNQNLYYFLFSCCLISRAATSIYYIEDIDSLRFAFSVIDEYNILKLQPHFPGYVIFCFIVNLIYGITGSLGLSFSLIGGISTFTIIYFSLHLSELDIKSKTGSFITLLLFFNPIIWIMGNRYMPDLMGLAILLASFYFLTSKKSSMIHIGSFLSGILTGIRLSYFPFVVIPYLYVAYNHTKIVRLSLFFIAGCLIGIIPLIWITGFENLFYAGIKHTSGHFYDYGGTMFTETNWQLRIKYFLYTIWSDGLGGYWENRSNLTLVFSIIFILIIFTAFRNLKKVILTNKRLQLLLLSTIIYGIWILLFQNIIFKSRHILPIVLIIILVVSFGLKNYKTNKLYLQSVLFTLAIIPLAVVTINITIQHKQTSAISQISGFLKSSKQNLTVISTPLINYYLQSTGVNGNFINLEENDNEVYNIQSNSDTALVIIGNFVNKLSPDINFITDTIFYHNPYVNRMWSEVGFYADKKF